MRSQKFEVGTYYLGLCFQYQGKDEAIPQIGQAEGLEYQISSLIKRMTQKKRKVAFTTGHGEQRPDQGFTVLKHVLDRSSRPPPSTRRRRRIPDDVDALVVGGPKQAVRRQGAPRDRRLPDEGQGRDLPGRRHGDAGAARRDAARDAGAAEDRPGQRHRPRRAAREVRLQDRRRTSSSTSQNVPGPVDIGGRKMLANLPVFVGVKIEPTDKDLSVLGRRRTRWCSRSPARSSWSARSPAASRRPGKLWTLAKTSPTAWKQTGFFFFSPDDEDRGGQGQGRRSAWPTPTRARSRAPIAPAAAARHVGARRGRRAAVRVEEAGAAGGGRRLRLRLRRVPAAGALPPHLPGRRADAVQRHQLDDRGRGADAGAHQDARPRARSRSSPTPRSRALKAINIAGVPLAFIVFGVVRWRLRRARRQGQKL